MTGAEMSSIDDGRDLRVPGGVGAAIRMGLAEIVQRLQVSTPLTATEAVEHIRYELNVLKGNYVKQGDQDGKGSE